MKRFVLIWICLILMLTGCKKQEEEVIFSNLGAEEIKARYDLTGKLPTSLSSNKISAFEISSEDGTVYYVMNINDDGIFYTIKGPDPMETEKEIDVHGREDVIQYVSKRIVQYDLASMNGMEEYDPDKEEPEVLIFVHYATDEYIFIHANQDNEKLNEFVDLFSQYMLEALLYYR